MLILSIALYGIAAILFCYIIYGIATTRKFTPDIAIGILGIVVSLILAIGVNPQSISTIANSAPISIQKDLEISTFGVGIFDQETIKLKNNTRVPIFLENWSIQVNGQPVYGFPKIVFVPGNVIFLQTTEGVDSTTSLYMNLQQSILQSGDLISLQDPTGKEYAHYKIP
jgi:hypothetical protein